MTPTQAIKAVRQARTVYAYVNITENEGDYVKVEKKNLKLVLRSLKAGDDKLNFVWCEQDLYIN